MSPVVWIALAYFVGLPIIGLALGLASHAYRQRRPKSLVPDAEFARIEAYANGTDVRHQARVATAEALARRRAHAQTFASRQGTGR